MTDTLRKWFDNEAARGFKNVGRDADPVGRDADPVGRDADPVDQEIDRIDWFRIVPFVVLHLGCAAVVWVGISPVAVGVAAAAYLVRMFAITAFYHRYFSHRAFRTSRAVQFAGAVLGAAATQRGVLWWAGVHRLHHRNADGDADPHSPNRGLLHAHVGWFLTRRYFVVDPRLTADWRRFPELVWLDRYDAAVPVAMATAMYTLGAALERWVPSAGTTGLQMLVWGYCISTTLLVHATCAINSFAHRSGTRRYPTGDDSRNNRWLALVTLGEGWHNNHHRYAGSARQGFFAGELDPTHAVLRLLERCGLVWDLRPVPQNVLIEGRSR